MLFDIMFWIGASMLVLLAIGAVLGPRPRRAMAESK